MNKQERLDIVVKTIECIYDNWQADGSFGRLVELLREKLDLGVPGSWEAIQCAGGLSINNALPCQDEELNLIVSGVVRTLSPFQKEILLSLYKK